MNKKNFFSSLVLVAALVAMNAQAQTTATAPQTDPQATAVVTPTETTSTDAVDSTSTIQVSGSVPGSDSGLSESVDFSGSVVVNSTVASDPNLGASSVVQIDGKGIRGIGSTTGASYLNGCEAILTRPFGSTDSITLTFSFFDTASGSYLRSKTAQLSLSLTYDTATKKMTNATGSVTSFKLAPQPVPIAATTNTAQ